MSTFGLYCLALLAGALIPLQASSNALLTKTTHHILYSALILFAIGFTITLVFTLIIKPPVPSIGSLIAAPIESYFGGFIVAFYVLSITFLTPRIGVGNAVLFIVTGQIFCAAVIDHFGLLGSPVFSLSPNRLLGLGLMTLGLVIARQ